MSTEKAAPAAQVDGIVRQRVVCCVCGKQVLRNRDPGRHDSYTTKAEGGRAGFGSAVFCGYCAEDLDDDGRFPGEM